jgi:hypothetical protein
MKTRKTAENQNPMPELYNSCVKCSCTRLPSPKDIQVQAHGERLCGLSMQFRTCKSVDDLGASVSSVYVDAALLPELSRACKP